MALSEGEQRRLDEIERRLALDDPSFVERIAHDGLRRPQVVVALAIFVMGMVAFIAGLVVTDASLWFGLTILIAGLAAMGAAVLIVLRKRVRR